MSKLEFDTSEDPSFADLDSPASAEIKELIANLQHSQQMLAELLNLEICALAETMDHFLPGFWSRFLENRHAAVQQFLQQKRACQSQVAATTDASDA